MQLDTLRLRLLKIGGRVWQQADWVRLRLAASHPGQPLWDHLAAYHCGTISPPTTASGE